MSVKIGTKRVCRCGRVIEAVKDPTVIDLDAGAWAHTTLAGRLRCGYAVPDDWDDEEESDDERE